MMRTHVIARSIELTNSEIRTNNHCLNRHLSAARIQWGNRGSDYTLADMTIGHAQEVNSDSSVSPQTSPRPQRPKVRDPRWLQVKVCLDFIAKKCTRSDLECTLAHPPSICSVENGRVTACFDAMKVWFFDFSNAATITAIVNCCLMLFDL